MKASKVGVLTLLLLCAPPVVGAGALPPAGGGAVDLGQLSLEELLNLEVTTVARRSGPLGETAAAVTVITQEDIRRSGATSIPEVLRLVPGVQVARLDANKWAVSARGAADRFSNRMLVLMDGRSIYTPLFSGVYWEIHDTMLEDIERIEVIRGPGGTLWGANAVNGIINIITKQAGDTPGTMVISGGGTEERGFGLVRHGGRLGEGTPYRVYGKYFKRDAGLGGADDWWMGRAGIRADGAWRDRNAVTVQSEIYDGDAGQRSLEPVLEGTYTRTMEERIGMRGGFARVRWQRQLTGSADWSLQSTYDRSRRREHLFAEDRGTFDLDFQHHLAPRGRQEISWGAGLRHTRDHITNSETLGFDPARTHRSLYTTFMRDELSLAGGRLRMAVGSKFEHNPSTNLVAQPSARASWDLAGEQVLWAAVSRAVRTPDRAFESIWARVLAVPPATLGPGAPAGFVTVWGDPDIAVEKVTAYELGYRLRSAETFLLDAATYYNRYQNEVTILPEAPYLVDDAETPHVVLPVRLHGDGSGETWGGELRAEVRPRGEWRLWAGYAYFRERHAYGQDYTGLDPVLADLARQLAQRGAPRHQLTVGSSFDLPGDWEIDPTVRYMGEIGRQGVGAYWTGDMRLAWAPRRGPEFSLVGQNLFEPSHQEFTAQVPDTQPTGVERGWYAKLAWRFQ